MSTAGASSFPALSRNAVEHRVTASGAQRLRGRVMRRRRRQAMGLGCARSEWDDFEWFPLHADDDNVPLVWIEDDATRVLLCDLDNLRADPRRLAARMRVAVEIARAADVPVFAGQAESVRRCGQLAAEFRDDVITVGSGRDAADHALLAVAERVRVHRVQFVVMSNDGIFARLALRGPLSVVSPSRERASSRLVKVARVLVDVSDLAEDEIMPAVA